MSLPIEEVIESLKRLVPTIPPAALIAIENDLEAKEAEKKEEKAADGPKQKNEYVTILLDPENKLDGLGDFMSLVVQIPEGQDAGETLERIYKSAYDQRASAKRKIKVINTLAEAAEWVKRKFFKENNVHIKNPLY